MEYSYDLFFVCLERVNVICRKDIWMINLCPKGIPPYINELE